MDSVAIQLGKFYRESKIMLTMPNQHAHRAAWTYESQWKWIPHTDGNRNEQESFDEHKCNHELCTYVYLTNCMAELLLVYV